MLIIALHNSQAYLERVNELARKESITNTTMIQKEDIGTYLTGEHIDIVVHMGTASHPYDKALIAIVEGEERAKRFLKVVEDDNMLDPLNLDDTGFICAVPFDYIKHLELESSHREKEKQ